MTSNRIEPIPRLGELPMPELQPRDWSDWDNPWRDHPWRSVFAGTLVVSACCVLCFGIIGWNNPALGNGFAGFLNGALIGLEMALVFGIFLVLIALCGLASRRLLDWTQR